MARALKKKHSKVEISEKNNSDTPVRLVKNERENYGQHSELEKSFKLKSEFFEKNVFLPERKNQENEPLTQVKVYRDSGIDVVDPRDLKSFIDENKGIKQVIVEKISVDEATRISLLFEPKHHASQFNTILEENILDLEEESATTEKVFTLSELENLINEEFLTDKKKPHLKVSTPKVEAVEAEPNEDKSDGELGFYIPQESAKKLNEPNTSDEESPKKAKKLNLKLKEKNNTPLVDNKVSYEKHTLTRKKSRSGHAYYYRAKDHVELYKVGSSYLKDFRSGLKSFSFLSTSLKEEKEKSVLGILSFFNYHEDLNICVITEDVKKSFYNRIANDLTEREAQVFDEDLYYSFYTGEGFEILEYSELKKVERKITEYNFESFLDQLLDTFDLILWDLPDIEILDANKELYFPVIRSLDNVSFIVGKNISKISEINEMISYFKRYQVPIKGLLFSENSSRGGKK